jgi:hypothetical protein
MEPTQSNPVPEQLPVQPTGGENQPRPAVPEAKPLSSGQPAPAQPQPAPAVAVPPAAPSAAQPQPVAAAPAASVTGPAVANDQDVIEKEWVDKADEVVAKTVGNPHAEEEAVEDLQIDYLKKRYNKDVKKSED